MESLTKKTEIKSQLKIAARRARQYRKGYEDSDYNDYEGGLSAMSFISITGAFLLAMIMILGSVASMAYLVFKLVEWGVNIL
jgi:hypothetical protein